ncbi:MAG: aliphatic sulfonate ABC transporter substrate-binding protein [Spirochaetia bacterium]|jgi:sulfonate transport system substrate-binding protein|nr:aliphatic sulfonate ABC transporter substrate-binding protein [Spirochaetia bacterium]
MSFLKKNIRLGVAAAVLFSLAAISGCGDKSPSKKPGAIRVGSTAPGHLKFILFEQLDILNKEFGKDGIKVEFFPFTGGGSEAVTTLATGGVDVIYTGVDPALRVAASGADVYLIGVSSFDVTNSLQSIAVAANSPIQSVADLKGKKVAYLTGTMRHNQLTRALKEHGLGLNDIESLNLNFDASGPALLRGDIDAFVESTSTIITLEQSGAIRLILDGRKKEHPQWVVPSVISANGKFVREYPDVVVRLLKADLGLASWVDSHFEETIQAFAKGTGQDPNAIRKLYTEGRFYQNTLVTPQMIQSFKDEEQFLLDAKLSNGKVDFDKWVQTKYVEEAAKALQADK